MNLHLLTEKDFDMIIDGLEALPNKKAIESISHDLIKVFMTGNINDAKKELEKAKINSKRESGETKLLIEEVRILQGKLLMLKRDLIDEQIIKNANDAIRKP